MENNYWKWEIDQYGNACEEKRTSETNIKLKQNESQNWHVSCGGIECMVCIT